MRNVMTIDSSIFWESLLLFEFENRHFRLLQRDYSYQSCREPRLQ